MTSANTSVQTAYALTWEYFRLAWRSLLMTTVAACCLAGLYRVALEPLGAQRDSFVFLSVFSTVLIVFVMTLLLNGRSDGLSLGFERRLYRLPVSTASLVFWRMLPAVVAIALMYLATSAFMRLAFNTKWPLLGPTLILIVLLVWSLALNWSLGQRPYLLAPVGLPLVFALFAWLRPHLKPHGTGVPQAWKDFGVGDATVLLTLALLGLGVAIVGVGRDRAEPRALQSLLASSSKAFDRTRDWLGTTSSPTEFRSAISAQLWMEWRGKGRWLPAWSLFGLLFSALATSFRDASFSLATGVSLQVETKEILGGAAVFFLLLLFLLPAAAGALHGRFNVSSQITTLDRLRATRPLSDKTLALTLQWATLRSLFASWISAGLGLSLLLFCCMVWGDTQELAVTLDRVQAVTSSLSSIDLALLGLVPFAWAVAASGMMLSLVLSGRNWIILLFADAPYGVLILGFLAERIGGFDAWRILLPYTAAFGVLVLPVMTAISAWLCYRRGYYSRRQLLRASMAFVFLSTMFAIRFPFLGAAFGVEELLLNRALALAAPAALSGVFLPLVLAPLMLAWNRHR